MKVLSLLLATLITAQMSNTGCQCNKDGCSIHSKGTKPWCYTDANCGTWTAGWGWWDYCERPSWVLTTTNLCKDGAAHSIEWNGDNFIICCDSTLFITD